jgi:hypothetical protein
MCASPDFERLHLIQIIPAFPPWRGIARRIASRAHSLAARSFACDPAP